MELKLTLPIFIGLFLIVVGEKIRYDNNRVYSVNIENEQQLKVLLNFEKSHDGVSFFETPSVVHKIPSEIVIPPHEFANISDLFGTHGIKNWLKIDNLQRLIDEEQPDVLSSDSFGWTKYHNLTAIYDWLDQLLEQYPKVLSNYNYGTSYENRTLRAVKVSYTKGNPTIFIESTIHAREWITAATATYFLNELLTSNDADIRTLAKNYDWVIVPVTNVDGYAFTHSTDRLWRKSRQPDIQQKQCIGADLNRNFDFHHADVGASKEPCNIMYAGSKPFSEPETFALSEFVKTFDNIKLYLAFHSYSQLILFPYGLPNLRPVNYNDLYQIGEKTRLAIEQRYQTDYVVGTFAEALYPGSGTSVDWMYSTQNISLAYTIEFRDLGKNGFILPADQIIPNSLEVIDGLKAMIKEATKLHYLHRKKTC